MRDYSTISPSAKTLLLMKGHTNIPFAKEASEIITQPENYKPDFGKRDLHFWMRVIHFEHRYWSINQLLEDLSIKNILELSSGFSFRGLDVVKQKNVHYIETDLPGVIEMKREIIASLQKDNKETKGQLEVLPLNALDEKAFKETVNHFDQGEVAIVHEGLLVYFDQQEKKNLCSIIREILKQRGGYWITADIYIKRTGDLNVRLNDDLQKFLDQHNIEEKKFETFEEAEKFFNAQGFVIDKEAMIDTTKLTSLPYMLQSATEEQLNSMKKYGKFQATWRLKLADQ